MKSREEVVKEMQLVVEQMRLDDIEENPDCDIINKVSGGRIFYRAVHGAE